LAVAKRLHESGHVALLAGGCVRDLLLGLEPKDYDVATDARPERVRSLFGNTQAVGEAFGVILVHLGQSVVEVATFRSDGPYSDGRRPDAVRFTDAQEDARRRDFTINGLFLDPIDNRVIDYVGGQKDLENRLLRAIGQADARFEEDHLRLLRAVRFAARFDFAIEAQTEQAIRRHAPHLARISPERVGEELRIMLTPPSRVRAWHTLAELGLADVIFRFMPLLAAGQPIAQRQFRIFDAITPGEPAAFALTLAAGALDRTHAAWPAGADFRVLFERLTARKMGHALRQSLRISNDELEAMAGVMEGLGPLVGDTEPGVATLKRFLALPIASDSRRLLAALHGVVDDRRVQWLQQRLSELEKTDFAPMPLVSGEDLIAAGLRPGPVFKRVLAQTYDAQLEGRVAGKQEAIKMALELAQAG
jgi:poly(A) polymerase